MSIMRWILAIVYALLFTYALVYALEPGSSIELGVLAGSVLTLVLAYAPGVAGYYDPLPASLKQTIFIVMMVFVSVVIFIAGCFGEIDVGILCSLSGALDLLMLLLLGIIGGQGVYLANRHIAAEARKQLK